MTDRAYIVSRTLETKIAMAENDGDHALIVTLDALKEILTTLKEQEEQIRKLTEEIEELRNKRNEVYYSGYDGSFIL